MSIKGASSDLSLRFLTSLALLLVLAVFFLILSSMIWHGISHISLDFFLEEPRQSGRGGGISSILAATFLILSVCMLTAFPLGLGTAMLLAEFSRRSPRFSASVRWSLEILAGVPSIVFGLFGNAVFSKILGLGFSILAGGLTLACMVLPILIKALEEGLRAVPSEYRQAGAALGFSPLGNLWHILIPAAFPSLLVGFVLGIGRALAETAALVFTSGYVDRMPSSLLDSGRSISVHIYDLSMNVAGGDSRAYASALVLVVILFFINGLSSFILDRIASFHRGHAA